MAARFDLAAFLRDERGATAIEYGLIVALICLAIITGLTAFGTKTTGTYQYIIDEISKVL